MATKNTDPPPPVPIRCSDLNMLWACPPAVLSRQGSGVKVKSQVGEATLVGRLVHSAIAKIIDGTFLDLTALVQNEGVSEDSMEEIEQLLGYFYTVRKELMPYLPQPRTEAVIEGPEMTVGQNRYQLTGTIDVCSPVSANKAVFIDWKTGRIDDAYNQQMNGYAWLLWTVMGRPSEISITGIVVFLRHRYYRVMKWDAADLSSWEYDLRHNVLPGDSTMAYSPGAYCTFCDLFTTCDARKQVVAGAIDDFLGRISKPGDATWLDRVKALLAGINEANKEEPAVCEAVAEILFRIRVCQKSIESARDLLKETVQRVGAMRIEPQRKVVIRQVEVRSLDPLTSMPVLRKYLSDRDVLSVSKISLPKLEKKVMSTADKGQKGEILLKFRAALEQANAVTTKTQERLEVIGVEADDDETEERD